jgi:hypothetical protein
MELTSAAVPTARVTSAPPPPAAPVHVIHKGRARHALHNLDTSQSLAAAVKSKNKAITVTGRGGL